MNGEPNRRLGDTGGAREGRLDRDDGLWARLPALAPGQAVVSLTSMRRPLLVAIDPAGAKLRMVE